MSNELNTLNPILLYKIYCLLQRQPGIVAFLRRKFTFFKKPNLSPKFNAESFHVIFSFAFIWIEFW